VDSAKVYLRMMSKESGQAAQKEQLKAEVLQELELQRKKKAGSPGCSIAEHSGSSEKRLLRSRCFVGSRLTLIRAPQEPGF
jgi:hypothetical protein